MIDRLFGKRKPPARIHSLPEVDPALARLAEKEIAQGRYRICDASAEGGAILLLSTEPRLVVSIHKESVDDGGTAVIIVEWVREAGPDPYAPTEMIAAS